LYGRRWQVETNLRHLKQTLRMDVLRCQTIEGVQKELTMYGLVYNMVRLVMLGERWIPLFPELRPHLEAVFDPEVAGDVPIITKSRDPGVNWRTTFQKIIKQAGLTPWEPLFQNLRASRETELAANYPLHVVTAWIGNSAPVAPRHYLSVTDLDFARAVGADSVHNSVQSPPDATERQATRVDRAQKGTAGKDGKSGV